MVTDRLGMTKSTITTTLLNRNANESGNVDLIDAAMVLGPAGATDENLAVFDGVTGKLLKDSGVALADVGDVVGPDGATDGDFAQFDGETGKLLKDGIALATEVGDPGDDATIVTEQGIREALALLQPMATLTTRGDLYQRGAATVERLAKPAAGSVLVAGADEWETNTLAALITALSNDVTQADGKYIATDKIRARDGDGLSLQDDGGNGIFVKDGGNVGIGTSAPASLFSIFGPSPVTVYTGQLEIAGSETTGAINTGGALQFIGHDGSIPRGWGYIRGFKENANVDDTASYMAFATRVAAVTEKMRIASGGNVGIGTVAAAAKLAVNGGVNVGADADPGDNCLYVVDDCSALTFSDRCTFPEIDALTAIRGIKGDGTGKLDHSSLPPCTRKTIRLKETTTETVIDEETGEEVQRPVIDEKTGEPLIREIVEDGRDLGAMVSVLTKALQEALARIEALEAKAGKIAPGK